MTKTTASVPNDPRRMLSTLTEEQKQGAKLIAFHADIDERTAARAILMGLAALRAHADRKRVAEVAKKHGVRLAK
jgi:hypothetical protein